MTSVVIIDILESSKQWRANSQPCISHKSRWERACYAQVCRVTLSRSTLSIFSISHKLEFIWISIRVHDAFVLFCGKSGVDIPRKVHQVTLNSILSETRVDWGVGVCQTSKAMRKAGWKGKTGILSLQFNRCTCKRAFVYGVIRNFLSCSNDM